MSSFHQVDLFLDRKWVAINDIILISWVVHIFKIHIHWYNRRSIKGFALVFSIHFRSNSYNWYLISNYYFDLLCEKLLKFEMEGPKICKRFEIRRTSEMSEQLLK